MPSSGPGCWIIDGVDTTGAVIDVSGPSLNVDDVEEVQIKPSGQCAGMPAS